MYFYNPDLVDETAISETLEANSRGAFGISRETTMIATWQITSTKSLRFWADSGPEKFVELRFRVKCPQSSFWIQYVPFLFQSVFRSQNTCKIGANKCTKNSFFATLLSTAAIREDRKKSLNPKIDPKNAQRATVSSFPRQSLIRIETIWLSVCKLQNNY